MSTESSQPQHTTTISMTERAPRNFSGSVGVTKIGLEQTKMRVLMPHLTPKMMRGAVDGLASTREERIEFFHLIQQTRYEQERNPLNSTPNIVTIDLPWNVLTRNDAYQPDRFVDPDNIAAMVIDWSDHKFAELRVAMIPVYDDNEVLIDVRFEVTDGWHRRCSLVERQLSTGNVFFRIKCSVSFCATVAEAAEMFYALNSTKARKPVTTKQAWLAAVMAEEPFAMRIVNLCASYGLNARANVRYRSWPNFPNGDAIINAIDNLQIGPDVTNRGLELYGMPSLVGLRAPLRKGLPDMLTSACFTGFCFFLARFEKPGFAHEAAIIRMLEDTSFLYRMSNYIKNMSSKDICDMLNISSVGAWEQQARYLKIAASLASVYEEYVTPPRSRKQSLWPDCPIELRNLFHVIRKESNEQKQQQQVAREHRRLVAHGMTPAFIVREITRESTQPERASERSLTR